MNFWLSLFLNGLVVGSIYSLLGLSMALVFGALRTVDLLRGDLAISTAYIAYFLVVDLRLSMFLATILACLLGGAIGVVVERFAYRPLRGQPTYVPLLSTLGLSLAIQGVLQLIFGAELRSFPAATHLKLESWRLGPLKISTVELLLLIGAAGLTTTLFFLIYKTRFGRSIRAVSEHEEAAAACGISQPFVFRLTFLLSSIISGYAGISIGLLYDLEPTSGLALTIRGFLVSVLGGSRGVIGATLAGLLLGTFESLVAGLLPQTYRDSFVFLLLFILLFLRPQGLLSRVTGRYP